MSRKSKLSLRFNSDSDDEDIPMAKLQKYKECIEQCAPILEDPMLSDNPLKMIDAVRKRLTEQLTKKARVQSTKKDIENIINIDISNNQDSSKGISQASLSDIQRNIAAKKEEILSLKETISEIEKSNESIQNEIESAKKRNEASAELASINSRIASLNDQYQKLFDDSEKLKNQEIELKRKLSEKGTHSSSQLLAEEQLKRFNIQTAIDSLRAEEEKRIAARHLFLNEKKASLNENLKNMKAKKSEILKEMGRAQHLEEEIARLNSLILREEKKIDQKTEKQKVPSLDTSFDIHSENQDSQVRPFNKDRIGRLIMLLFTDGLNRTVVDNLAEELCWSKQQTDDFLALANGRSESGSIGAMWVDWLNKLVAD
ncbi:hypothetical protein TRFO_32637 [Tritrichomonas foetus]|uniref:Uncharacterized protein n=1 Tax=Tritrichomonas foetus TaxID=1144522 RepID=A0A1J4JTQ8_9EUKA|nr:hypothetical protein TRFO_32637 [Tritrichomonas foetus]|eukprot:OHT00661.1 hypothetical protein TRFO_32637 [Tritrichomonas foetus]